MWPGQCNFKLETAIGDTMRSPVRNLTELISQGENLRDEMYVVDQSNLISPHLGAVLWLCYGLAMYCWMAVGRIYIVFHIELDLIEY